MKQHSPQHPRSPLLAADSDSYAGSTPDDGDRMNLPDLAWSDAASDLIMPYAKNGHNQGQLSTVVGDLISIGAISGYPRKYLIVKGIKRQEIAQKGRSSRPIGNYTPGKVGPVSTLVDFAGKSFFSRDTTTCANSNCNSSPAPEQVNNTYLSNSPSLIGANLRKQAPALYSTGSSRPFCGQTLG